MSTFFLVSLISIGILVTLFSIAVLTVFLLAFFVPNDHDMDV
jgi:hypothetical protein